MTVLETVEDVEEPAPDLVLDLKGLVCPVPVVKVANAIKGLELGGVIEASATDPGVLADIPAWCHATGHELLKIGRNGREFAFWVKRTK
ncbi:MAG: sulfurtransferase TusA family protein [bacterium]|nr:sulfurtransferase TusA family protein [bacterium]